MNESIIRTDRRGRLRYTADQKQNLIEAYESSGLSGPKFAELHGVCYQTLVYWIKKRQSSAYPLALFRQDLSLRISNHLV